MKLKVSILIIVLSAVVFQNGCMRKNSNQKESRVVMNSQNERESGNKYEVATFGEGCFWCTEAVFQRLNGVIKVESGYSGGIVKDPTYREVCSGQTGHAEVSRITYDPDKISYVELLEVFWKTHDPTTLNRQGADVGTQYRSVIFYHNDEQKRLALEYKRKLEEEKIWDDPIVTEISPAREFYMAEEYHQNYYNNNTAQPYCTFVITPKLEKFRKVFSGKIRKVAEP
ncbi:MAG: peptide-methionine (S)-S-oxide reductase MsrA [Ignavibacteria bacterium]|nr:peptide-methionine (S)-S-oxide reductase MsrA [Ignavibacteria bacterium]MCU7505091.1 peptide-methionine (S)-S-oxide reductase MsrA [Ignavibacteria bacterium]MCU7518077.1 peptide-methionine (S)-S-oxide reductase MsrA [Ignavibacteria bacterium]